MAGRRPRTGQRARSRWGATPALILIVMAPVILTSTFLLSVFPGAREKLEKCEH